MTRSERERHIERYLSGQMTPAEEQDFFIQAALDRDTRYELKALMTVDSAIRKERDAEPGEHTALRSRVATILAAVPAPEQPAPSPVNPAAPPAATGLLQKLLPMHWLGIAVATMVVVTSVFMLTDSTRDIHNGGSEPAYEQRQEIPAGDLRPAPQGKTDRTMPSVGDTPSRETGARSDGAQTEKTVTEAPRNQRESAPHDAIRQGSTNAGRASGRNGERPAVSASRTASNNPVTETETAERAEGEENSPITLGKPKRDSIPVGVHIRIKDR